MGLACGDALGTTLEFIERDQVDPIEGIVGGGPFKLEAGQWTDDTAMMLCLAESLNDQNGFDPVDRMNRYGKWFTDGYISCTGTCFDIGQTIRKALMRFKKTGESAGRRVGSQGGMNRIHSGKSLWRCVERLRPGFIWLFRLC